MNENYPDWCTGEEKLRCIDGIEQRCIREQELSEIEWEIHQTQEKLDQLYSQLQALLEQV